MTAQQLTRNTQLFQSNAVPQRVLEASQTEARQASIVSRSGGKCFGSAAFPTTRSRS